jgi:hypothetical protein
MLLLFGIGAATASGAGFTDAALASIQVFFDADAEPISRCHFLLKCLKLCLIA